MGNTGPHGIISLPNGFRTVIGALNSDTVFQIDDDYGEDALTRDFLCKKIRTQAVLEDFPADEFLVVGFARGDMSLTDISSALAVPTADPEDFQLWDNFATKNGIFWETLQMISGIANVATPPNSNPNIWNMTVSLGGGKGIPLEAGHGIQLFVFNPSGNQIGSAGATLFGLYQLVGVFMEGSN